MGWDNVGKGGGDSDFLKLDPGASTTLHVLSDEPFSFLQVFNQDTKKGVCVPEGFKHATAKARAQHALVVYDLNEQDVKIWVGGNKVMDQLKAIHESYGTLDKVDITLGRKGAGLKTKYQVVPKPSTFDQKVIEGLDLPDVQKIFAVATDEAIEDCISGIVREDDDEERTPAKAPAAAAPAPAAKPEPTPASTDEIDLPIEKSPPKSRGSKNTPPSQRFTGVRVIRDVRTDKDAECSKCSKKRTLREGNVKAIDDTSNLPWGRVKVLICKDCNGMEVVEKLPEAEPVAA